MATLAQRTNARTIKDLEEYHTAHSQAKCWVFPVRDRSGEKRVWTPLGDVTHVVLCSTMGGRDIALYYHSLDEATAGAVQLILKGWAKGIVHKKPRWV